MEIKIGVFIFCLLIQAFGKKRDENHPKIHFPERADTDHEDKDYWMQLSKEAILESLEGSADINTNTAKNIIIFIGDGMSLPTITASRIYKAQYEARQQGIPVNGEESFLTFDKFPHIALSKTYSVNTQTPDSAATATAIFSGIKTDFETIGFDNSIVYGDPYSALEATKIDTILKWAQDAGMDTGLVTNTKLSDATPAALYAHSAARQWECEAEMPSDRPSEIKDITWQLVNNDPGRKAKVVMGGGRSSFLPLTKVDDRWDYSQDDWECRRDDEVNLIDQFLNKSALVPGFEGKKGVLVETRQQLLDLDIDKTDYVLGIFSWDHMKFECDREPEEDTPEGEPSLAEMTEAAIKILRKNTDGYFLMVEGGKIDDSHHFSKAVKAMHETMGFDKAIKKAVEMVNFEDTLVIVTADHSHVMTMAGYPSRGTDIRGLNDRNRGSDRRPYTILSYGNGEGFAKHLTVEDGNVARVDLTGRDEEIKDFEYIFPSNVPLSSETHSGADVGIFAKGPYAHLFHSVHEQNFIGHVMAYSACIGPYTDDCHSKRN